MMKKLTKEQFDYLQQFEERMLCATKANYCRNVLQRDLEQIKSIYEELTGKNYKMRYSCSTCILNLIKDISVPYFKYKEELNDKERESETIVDSEEKPKRRKAGKSRDSNKSNGNEN